MVLILTIMAMWATIKMFCAVCRWMVQAIRSSLSNRRQRVLPEAVEQDERVQPDTNKTLLIEQRKAERQRKVEAERRQAAADEQFLIDQIDKLYAMLWEADEDLELARQNCKHDNEMNRSGAVVADKVVNKHRADRDKLSKKVMNLERSIHAYETKLNKVRFVLAC